MNKKIYKLHFVLLDETKPISEENFCRCEAFEIKSHLNYQIDSFFIFESFIEKIRNERHKILITSEIEFRQLHQLKLNTSNMTML